MRVSAMDAPGLVVFKVDRGPNGTTKTEPQVLAFPRCDVCFRLDWDTHVCEDEGG